MGLYKGIKSNGYEKNEGKNKLLILFIFIRLYFNPVDKGEIVATYHVFIVYMKSKVMLPKVQ